MSDPSFTHSELVEITTKTLKELIDSEPLLSDLPNDPSLDELQAQLALQHGRSILVNVKKDNGQNLPVIVHHGATVGELKQAIKRHTNNLLKRENENAKISWKYIWRTNVLMHEHNVLEEDNIKLLDLGIVTGSKVVFARKRRHKNSIKK